MLEGLYNWTLEKAAHRHAIWWLAVFAFAEATFFPLPADVLLIPMVLAARERAWRLSLVAALASATGGEFGYVLGYFLYDQIGRPIMEFYGYLEEFADLQEQYRRFGVWIVAIGAISPIPYKVVTITSGVAEMDIWAYTATSYATRAVRFFAVGGALYWFGPYVRRFMDNNLKLAFMLFMVLFVGGFAAAYWLA